MRGFIGLCVRIEASQKTQFPQFVQCCRRQEFDFLRPLLESVGSRISDDGVQMRPFLCVLGEQVTILGELQTLDLGRRKLDDRGCGVLISVRGRVQCSVLG